MISGSESGCLRLQNQAFGFRGVAKTTSHVYRDSVTLVSFLMFLLSLRELFGDFRCLGDRLEML